MHVHSRRERKLYGYVGVASIHVLVFRCARDECRALWRVLPKFMARHLWRAWSTVADAVETKPGEPCPVPRRTRLRWKARLRERAAVLVAVLATSGNATRRRHRARPHAQHEATTGLDPLGDLEREHYHDDNED